MSADELLAAVRATGCGVTMNAWTEHPDVALLAWREGVPVADAHADTLTGALALLLERLS